MTRRRYHVAIRKRRNQTQRTAGMPRRVYVPQQISTTTSPPPSPPTTTTTTTATTTTMSPYFTGRTYRKSPEGLTNSCPYGTLRNKKAMQEPQTTGKDRIEETTPGNTNSP
uniref:Uncharacterized protein n=1 Tax=Vespula pensylvanica TaxID=30213 RepID=A0A834NZI5_VESPE|nr:hypothetical protein H0235_009806 [Vespula pensylvanica]